MRLTYGRGGLRLPEEALAAGQPAVRDAASHHTGLDLLKVVRLSRDFDLQKADVGLISCLLLGGHTGRGEDRIEIRGTLSTLIFSSAVVSDTSGLDEMTNTS